jgi:hypothetical protein
MLGQKRRSYCLAPKSPDLTPLDFFAWGFIKDIVYRRKVRDLADLRQCIIEAVELNNTSHADKHVARA